MTLLKKPKMLIIKNLPTTVLSCGFDLKKGVRIATKAAKRNGVILVNVSDALSYLQQLVWHVSSFAHKNADKALTVMKQAINEHGNVIDFQYHVKYMIHQGTSPVWDLVIGEKARDDKMIELEKMGYKPVVDTPETTPVYDM
jgi:hypothetical protein